jgi:myo-inositol-1(or 4)-monophosphatase
MTASEARLTLARDLVARAGAMARAAFGNPDLAIESKGPGDVVSAADFAIERMMRDAVGAAFPDDRFIGEEFGGEAATEGYTWLIDPIDGTVNFARRLGYFCVSLSLLRDLRPIAAWILDPVLDELFWAGPDGQARLGDTPIACADEADLHEAVIGLGYTRRHESELGGIIVGRLFAAGAEHRRLGAGALCLAHVAAGRLDAYCEPHMNPWDAVGGLYIAACAGAATGDYIGAGGLATGAPVFAATPAIADQLQALLPAPFSDVRRLAGRPAETMRAHRNLNVETKR